MEALVHDKPHKCRTFAEHCTKAFFLGTSTKHYRCWKFWTPTTRATRISGAAFFKHKYLTNPSITLEDRVIAAAAHLKDTLEGIRSPQLQTSTLKSLGDLQDIFHEATNTTHNRDEMRTSTHPTKNPTKGDEMRTSTHPPKNPTKGDERRTSTHPTRVTPNEEIITQEL
jgi:hypothetical protein